MSTMSTHHAGVSSHIVGVNCEVCNPTDEQTNHAVDQAGLIVVATPYSTIRNAIGFALICHGQEV